jgi:hypothetical protein
MKRRHWLALVLVAGVAFALGWIVRDTRPARSAAPTNAPAVEAIELDTVVEVRVPTGEFITDADGTGPARPVMKATRLHVFRSFAEGGTTRYSKGGRPSDAPPWEIVVNGTTYVAAPTDK